MLPELIEGSCWGEDLSAGKEVRPGVFQGCGKYWRSVFRYSIGPLLTDLEFEMLQVMGHVVAFIDDGDGAGKEAVRLMNEVMDKASAKGRRRMTAQEIDDLPSLPS